MGLFDFGLIVLGAVCIGLAAWWQRQHKKQYGLDQREKERVAEVWRLAADKYQEGQVISGRVRKLDSFNAVVEIEEGIAGDVNVMDFRFSSTGTAHDLLEEGQEVKVVVLNVNADQQHLLLELKQLNGS